MTPSPEQPEHDLCAHGCGTEATVQHADGRYLCLPCYTNDTGGDVENPSCPTCGQAEQPEHEEARMAEEAMAAQAEALQMTEHEEAPYIARKAEHDHRCDVEKDQARIVEASYRRGAEHEEVRREEDMQDALSFSHGELAEMIVSVRHKLSRAEQEREDAVEALEKAARISNLRGQQLTRTERELERLREAICAEAHVFPPDAVAGSSCYCGKAAW